MQERMKLISNRKNELTVSLQAGSLWNGEKMIELKSSSHQNGYSYFVDNGKITVDGKCVKVNENYYTIDFFLTNKGEDTELKFNYPYLLYKFPKEKTIRVFNNTFGGILESIKWGLFLTYPGRGSFCFTAASGKDRTVTCGLFNDEQRYTVIRNMPGGNEGHIRLTLEKIALKKGQTIKLPTQFICTGNDWSESMLPYKNWLADTFPSLNNRPDWLEDGNFSETRKAHCIAPFNPPEKAAGLWMFSEEGEPRTFELLKKEVDEIVEEGKEKGFSPLFYQFGWWSNLEKIKGLLLFDSVCGDYTSSHPIAKKIVKYIHERGCRTYLYTNAIAAGDETAVFYNSPELFVTGKDNLPVYNGQLPMYFFCPGAPGIKEYWKNVLKYILIDMDADGVFLDQIAGAEPPPFCYNPSHDHCHPDTYGKEIIELIKFIRKEAKRLKPDCCVMGELILDSRSGLLDESHGYGYSGIVSKPPENSKEQKTTIPPEYYIFTRFLSPKIFTQIGHSEDDIMNGSAGHFRDGVWKKYRKVFETGVICCKVNVPGALAYLFGPYENTYILAVRAQGDIGRVAITVPNGKEIEVEACLKPKYLPLNMNMCKK